MENSIAPLQIQKVNDASISYRKIGSGTRKILFFHGFPGSSAQIELFKDQLTAFDLQVVCIDRPGYNQSEVRGASQFDQTNQALHELLKSFGWSQCEVISVSGGTPFLFSFVQAEPQFISRVTVVSGLGPIATEKFRDLLQPKMKVALRLLPLLPGNLFEKILPKAGGKPPRFNLIRFLMPVSKADVAVIQTEGILPVLGTALHEAFAQKGVGPKRDAGVYLKPWKLEMGSYKGRVDIWHGQEDRILPARMAKLMHQSLPQAKLYLVPNEGHYSLAMNRIQHILS